mgnify:FL=1
MTDTTDTSIFTVRSWEQLRAFLYVLVPVVIGALGVAHSEVWIGLALAVLAPTLSAIKTVNGFRTWLYAVIAAIQAVLLVLDLATSVQISLWVPIIVAIIGGGVAAPRVATAR